MLNPTDTPTRTPVTASFTRLRPIVRAKSTAHPMANQTTGPDCSYERKAKTAMPAKLPARSQEYAASLFSIRANVRPSSLPRGTKKAKLPKKMTRISSQAGMERERSWTSQTIASPTPPAGST